MRLSAAICAGKPNSATRVLGAGSSCRRSVRSMLSRSIRASNSNGTSPTMFCVLSSVWNVAPHTCRRPFSPR